MICVFILFFYILIGSHWTQEIISMLLSQKAEYNLKESIGQINMECWMDFDKVNKISEPRLFHTHLPFSYLPKKHVENGYKIIYVNRNPKDRAVSQYHFLSGKVGVPQWTWNEFFENYVLKGNANCTEIATVMDIRYTY